MIFSFPAVIPEPLILLFLQVGFSASSGIDLGRAFLTSAAGRGKKCHVGFKGLAGDYRGKNQCRLRGGSFPRFSKTPDRLKWNYVFERHSYLRKFCKTLMVKQLNILKMHSSEGYFLKSYACISNHGLN